MQLICGRTVGVCGQRRPRQLGGVSVRRFGGLPVLREIFVSAVAAPKPDRKIARVAHGLHRPLGQQVRGTVYRMFESLRVGLLKFRTLLAQLKAGRLSWPVAVISARGTIPPLRRFQLRGARSPHRRRRGALRCSGARGMTPY